MFYFVISSNDFFRYILFGLIDTSTPQRGRTQPLESVNLNKEVFEAMVDRYTQMKVTLIHSGRCRTHVSVTGLVRSPYLEFLGVRVKNVLTC